MSCYHVTVKSTICSFPVILLSISFCFCLVHCEHPRFLVEIKTAVSHIPKNLIVNFNLEMIYPNFPRCRNDLTGKARFG